MANTVGGANVEISADDRKARSTLGKFMGFLKGTARTAAGVATGIAVFKGVAGAIKGASSSTIGANASMEQYQNTLTVVMKSSKKAAQTLAWAKDFANKTPFETDEIVDATAKLSAYGLNARKILPEIGDMSSVMGKSLDQGVEAIADAQTGELERLKEFGITKNMIVDQAKQMRLGLVVNNKGQITDQKKFNQALFGLMQDRYKNGMKIQSTTWNGMLSNIRGFMSTAIQTLSKPMFLKLEAGLRQIMPLFDGLTALMEGDIKGFNDSINKVFGNSVGGKIIGFFNLINDAVSGFREGYANGFVEMQNKTQTFAARLGDSFYNVMGVIAKVKDGFVGLFNLLIGNTSKGVSILKSLGFSSDQVNMIVQFVTTIKQTIASLMPAVTSTFLFVRQAVTLAIEFIISAAQTILPYLMPVLTDIFNFIKSVLNQITSFWQQNGETILAAVKNVFGIIKGIIAIVMPAVSSIISTAWNLIKGIFQSSLDIIMGLIKIFAGLFTGNWGMLWDGVKQLVGGALKGIWSIIQAAFGVIVSGAKLFGSVFKAVFSALWSGITWLWDHSIGWIINLVTSNWSKLSPIMLGPIRAISSALKAIWSGITWLWDHSIGWIISTVQSNWPEIKSIILGPMNGIKSGVQRAFGFIHDYIVNPIRNAMNKVGGFIDKIKGFFSNMKIHIPMPHFNFSTIKKKIAGITMPVPDLSVNWFKNGGIFPANSPRLVGMGDANVPEAALPLSDSVLGRLAKMIAAHSPEGNGTSGITLIIQNLNNYTTKTAEQIANELGFLIRRKVK